MRDFNYFSSYIKVQNKPSRKMIMLVVLSALVLALIGYYQFSLIMKTNALKDDIAEVDAFLTSSETLSKVNEVNDKQMKEAALQLAYSDLMNVAMLMEASSQVDEMLIEKINAQVPLGLFIDDLNITEAFMTVKGYALEYTTIAQFAHNLRHAGGLEQVLIPTITEDSGSYYYTITSVIIKEGYYEN